MFDDFLTKNTSVSQITGSSEILSVQFEEEILRKKEKVNSWFEYVQALNCLKSEILKEEESSIYAPLWSSLEKALQKYENEKEERPELELPNIPEESLRTMMLFFPFLYGKDYAFYMDSDLSCAAVLIRSNKNERITIATKSPTLLFLSKVGENEDN